MWYHAIVHLLIMFPKTFYTEVKYWKILFPKHFTLINLVSKTFDNLSCIDCKISKFTLRSCLEIQFLG